MFVRYSVYVMALGHVFHLLWGTEDIDDWIFGLMGALGVELILWEMIGNSDFVYNKIRDDDSEEYGASVKDSLKSVVNDLCFCGVGYFTGAVFLSLEMVWLSGVCCLLGLSGVSLGLSAVDVWSSRCIHTG